MDKFKTEGRFFMRRLFATILSGLMLASSIPAISLADVDSVPAVSAVASDSSVSSEPTAENMEKALLAVKAKISIPAEYSEFNYYFYDSSSYSNPYWKFVWRTSDGYSGIQVDCDTNYRITYYYKYNYNDKPAGIAKYLKSELKPKADEFIVKIAPELKNKFEFVSDEYASIYSGDYVYRYQRNENSVAFPDNTIEVGVNSITGEVTYASINWLYDKALPLAKAKITKEEAAKIIKENMTMKLVYKSDYIGIYDKNGNRKTRAYLVYEPSQDYIAVDAKTGEVYNESTEWVAANKSKSATEEASMDTKADTPVGLTDKEIAKIQELNNLISKDKAIEIVTSNKSLYIDKNLKSITASLSKIEKTDGSASYVWYINMRDPRKVDYTTDDTFRAYAYAAVDAKSGNIISFYANLPSYYNPEERKLDSVKVKYSKDEAREILESFLKKQISSKFKNSILVYSYDDYIIYYDVNKNKPVYGGYSFTYNRTNEGIEYPYNSIYGSVDGVTGKIYNYGYNWNDNVVFESAKGVISAEKAMDYYLANKGFDLKYEINTINKYDDGDTGYGSGYSVDYEIRLVYRPDVYPQYISPFTGEQLDYDGTVYKEKQPYTYSDITDPVLYRDIFLLADMGVGFEGGMFLPDKAITAGELNKLLSGIGYGYFNEDDTANNKTITRELAAYTFISRLGLEKVAKLSDIYKTGYNDEADINKDYLGAVALAKALGLMEADSLNNFNPKKEVTRLESVKLITNYINVQKTGIY